jgi:hypothetical protein
MPHFICPNCGNRSLASERTAGFRREARGCSNCGFGFLFELLDVIGRPVQEVLGLEWENGSDDYIGTALEWGVRVLDKPVLVHAEGDRAEPAKADIFPAYDEDGGLLLVLTPR